MSRPPRALLWFLALLVPLAPLQGEETKADPVLEILSRQGVVKEVKIYNEEPLVLLARASGEAQGLPLRGVTFILYDEGGSPGRSECVRARKTDGDMWGRPPSTFEFPLEQKIPLGRYRLRAEKPRHTSTEIKIILARFEYTDLKADHTKEHYRASFGIRLTDPTETRKSLRVEVRIEARNRGLIDTATVELRPHGLKAGVFENTSRVRLSSRVKAPKNTAEAPLRLVPGATVVFVLDKVRFTFPVPLPVEEKKGSAGLGEHGGGRR